MSEQVAKSIEFPYLHIEESPGFLTWQIAMCWQRKINQELAKHGLTYTQFVVLSITGWLRRKHSNIYQHQVATHARIDRMMTSRVMGSLEKKKLIRRVKQLGDARTNFVILTKKGEEALMKSLKIVTEMEQNFFKTDASPGPDIITFMQQLLPEC